MEGLIEGRIVHFVLNDEKHRPAIIVRVWHATPSYPEGTVNLQIFLDGKNDRTVGIVRGEFDTTLLAWRTSVHYSEDKEPGTWHWIEKA